MSSIREVPTTARTQGHVVNYLHWLQVSSKYAKRASNFNARTTSYIHLAPFYIYIFTQLCCESQKRISSDVWRIKDLFALFECFVVVL